MIALDTNILIHLLVKSQTEHPRVYAWFTNEKGRFVTTPVNIAECLRLLTHHLVFARPLSIITAVDLLDEFISDFEVKILEESSDWWLDLKWLGQEIPTLRGNEVFDARIALCLQYNGIKNIATLDSDFLKYPFLKIVKI